MNKLITSKEIKQRILPDYKKEKHDKYADYWHARGDPEYDIDWSRNATQYKTLMAGVRLYTIGELEIDNRGYYNPSWRAQVKAKLGFEVVVVRQSPGYRFKLPNGTPVSKHNIDQDVLLLDPTLQCCFAFDCREPMIFRENLRFPINAGPIRTKTANPERRKQLFDKFAEARAVGLTLLRTKPDQQPTYIYDIEDCIRAEKPPRDFTKEREQNICISLAKYAERVDQLLIEQSYDTNKYEFLLYEQVTTKGK